MKFAIVSILAATALAAPQWRVPGLTEIAKSAGVDSPNGDKNTANGGINIPVIPIDIPIPVNVPINVPIVSPDNQVGGIGSEQGA